MSYLVVLLTTIWISASGTQEITVLRAHSVKECENMRDTWLATQKFEAILDSPSPYVQPVFSAGCRIVAVGPTIHG